MFEIPAYSSAEANEREINRYGEDVFGKYADVSRRNRERKHERGGKGCRAFFAHSRNVFHAANTETARERRFKTAGSRSRYGIVLAEKENHGGDGEPLVQHPGNGR